MYHILEDDQQENRKKNKLKTIFNRRCFARKHTHILNFNEDTH